MCNGRRTLLFVVAVVVVLVAEVVGDDQNADTQLPLEPAEEVQHFALNRDVDRGDLDEEEVEAMKDITSVVNVKDMDDIDIEQYPRFVIRDFDETKGVDRLLQLLLPIAKVVYEKQEDQAESARMAADLREKQETLRQRRKANQKLEARTAGYNPYMD